MTVSTSTLTIMVISSLSFLLATQLPSALTSARLRFFIGFVSAAILGIGILILEDSMSLFVAVLAIVAVLPRHSSQASTILAVLLTVIHLGGRLLFFDFSNYYETAQVFRTINHLFLAASLPSSSFNEFTLFDRSLVLGMQRSRLSIRSDSRGFVL